MATEDIFKNLPNHLVFTVDQFFGRFYRFYNTAFNQFPNNERLEQFGSHRFRDTAFVQFQGRTYDDNGTTGVVDTFTEQVLTETTLFTFQDIGQRFQRAATFRFHGVGFPRVVEQRVDSLLQHTLFVAQDHLRRFDFEQALQAVVPYNYAAVQVVQVGRRKTATVQRHQRAQFWWYDGQVLDNGPFRALTGRFEALAEGFNDAEAFVGFRFLRHTGFGMGIVAQLSGQVIEVERAQQGENRVGAHFGHKLIGMQIVEQVVFLRQCVEDLQVFFFSQQVHTAHAFFGFNTRLHHYVTFVVDDRLEFFRRSTQQIRDLVRQTFEKPDVNHRHNQADVSHTFAAYFFLRYLYTAAVADDAFVTNTFVLSAVAFIVFYRTKNTFAEQTVAFGFV